MSDVGFEGKGAIITGAGGGLGREHALLLASRRLEGLNGGEPLIPSTVVGCPPESISSGIDATWLLPQRH